MPLHSKIKYHFFIYRAILRLEILRSVKPKTSGEFLFFMHLHFAHLYEIIKAIKINDFGAFTSYGFDKIPKKDMAILKTERDLMFHFPENIDTAFPREVEINEMNYESLKALFVGVFKYRDEIASKTASVTEMKKRMDKPHKS